MPRSPVTETKKPRFPVTETKKSRFPVTQTMRAKLSLRALLGTLLGDSLWLSLGKLIGAHIAEDNSGKKASCVKTDA